MMKAYIDRNHDENFKWKPGRWFADSNTNKAARIFVKTSKGLYR